MNADRDRELRARYSDLLEDAADEPRLRFLHHLDRAYRVVSHGRVALPSIRPQTRSQVSTSPRGIGGWRSTFRMLSCPSRRLIVVALAAVIVASGGTLSIAATGILNLGKPTSSTVRNSTFPLSGFHRSSLATLRSGGRPELLWIGTAWPGDSASDVERWPLVKALESFGTFRRMAVGSQSCLTKTYTYLSGTTHDRMCNLATFDWSHATYHSRYVTLVHRDLIDSQAKAHAGMSATERRLYVRYVQNSPGTGVQNFAASLFQPDIWTHVGRTFPLVAIDGYVETTSQVPLFGDLGNGEAMLQNSTQTKEGLPFNMYEEPLTFQQIQAALMMGKTPVFASPGPGYPATPASGLISDVNAEANVITALICHADGGKPGKVCGRSVIKALTKHIR